MFKREIELDMFAYDLGEVVQFWPLPFVEDTSVLRGGKLTHHQLP